MIIATNRRYWGSKLDPNWNYNPETVKGTVHWLEVQGHSSGGLEVVRNITSDKEKLTQEIQSQIENQLSATNSMNILILIPGARPISTKTS